MVARFCHPYRRFCLPRGGQARVYLTSALIYPPPQGPGNQLWPSLSQILPPHRGETRAYLTYAIFYPQGPGGMARELTTQGFNAAQELPCQQGWAS